VGAAENLRATVARIVDIELVFRCRRGKLQEREARMGGAVRKSVGGAAPWMKAVERRQALQSLLEKVDEKGYAGMEGHDGVSLFGL